MCVRSVEVITHDACEKEAIGIGKEKVVLSAFFDHPPHHPSAQRARRVAHEGGKVENLNDPVRVALAFGYAVYPGDGGDHDTLVESANNPRIRML